MTSSSSRRQVLRLLGGGSVGGLLMALGSRPVAGQESGTPGSKMHDECGTPVSESEKVAFLELELNQRNADLAFVIMLISGVAEARIMGDPLDEFFSHPEDWEIVIPVDPIGGCGWKECGEPYRFDLKQCQELPQEEQEACKAEALERVIQCNKGCWEQFPFPT